MKVRVLVFGMLKDLLPLESGTVDLADGSTVAQLVSHLLAHSLQAQSYTDSLAIAVNREYATPAQVLRDGDEVALLPPVSGGVEIAEPARNLVRLQREPIDPAHFLQQLKSGSDGAVAIFDGIVRDNSRGRRTLYLDYEAYEEMALNQMRRLADEAKRSFGVREIALVHRLGRLQIGETSVWIAVAAAHRAQAFDACRWIIDTLKKTVPIWKKEHFEDGAVWADGEPFPAEIAVRGHEDDR